MEKRVNLKDMPVRSRMSYIWEYYKLWIIGGIALLAVLISAVSATFGIHKDVAIGVTLVNADTVNVSESSLFDDFVEANYDTKYEKAEISSNLTIALDDVGTASGTAYQVLSAQMLAGEIDAFISDAAVCEYMAQGGSLADLTNVLSEKQLEEYADLLVYTTDEETGEKYPYGVSLENCTRFTDEKLMVSPGILCAGITSKRMDAVSQLLDYLLDD